MPATGKKKSTTKRQTKQKQPKKKVVSAKSASRPKLAKPKQLLLPANVKKTPARFAWLQQRWYGRVQLSLGSAVLLLTTIWWSWQGAQVESSNADQLADAYLFQDNDVFRNALFPGTHTFLLKWPLFLLIRLNHDSSAIFTTVTIGLCLVTVGALAWILSRIERRPTVLAAYYLALASVLWLVPAQMQPGTLLPVNMAMTTTRNLEYAVYLLAIVLTIKSRPSKWWRFTAAVFLLAIVFASDKLFMGISIAAGLSGLLVYGLCRRWLVGRLFMKWLVVSIVAAALATGLLFTIDQSGYTPHVVGSVAASPYASSHKLHTVVLATIYAVLGTATNFGANPAFDVTEFQAIPRQIIHRLLSLSGISFLVNIVILLGLLVAAWQLLRGSFRLKPADSAASEPRNLSTAASLSVILLWIVAALLGVFIFTDHYYAGDTRYLTLLLFALFIVAATVLRRRSIKPVWTFGFSILCIIAIIAAAPLVNTTSREQKAAYSDLNYRDQAIHQVLSQHKASILVGDYWRVLPIKSIDQKQSILPLETCTQPRSVLTSKAWNVDLHQHSFAYLLSLDRSLTDFPKCSLQEINQAYGHPNSSITISGTVTNPREQLLFYDQGIRPKPNHKMSAFTASLIPPPIDRLRVPTCNGRTILQIVAHQDDDLLFMNPDMLHDIQAGNCIRTMYVTAGDAGGGKFYWLGREQGSEAAYNYLRNRPGAAWDQRTVKLGDKQFATITTPHGTSSQSLVFLHLPDGNVDGTGFAVSQHESLQKLDDGSIGTIQSIDGQSVYTKQTLINAISAFIKFYHPAEIRTQANLLSLEYPDHSDHMAVGRLTKQAYEQYQQSLPTSEVPPPLKFYIGYPVHAKGPNVDGDDLSRKQAAFFQYARYDGGVCHSMEECNGRAVYGAYLRRQYQNDY